MKIRQWVSLLLVTGMAMFPIIGMEMNLMRAYAGVEYPVPSAEERLAYEPVSFEQELAQEKALGDGQQLFDEHWALQAVYQQAFWEVLVEAYPLQKVDDELADGEMRLIPVPEEECGVYQKYNAHGMRFFFLRNHFHIERLGEEDLALLRKVLATEESPEALTEMVRRTYADLIRLDFDGNSEQFEAVYEMSALWGHSAPNDALVLGLATAPEYDQDGNFASLEHEEVKSLFLMAFAERIEAEMTAVLGIPVVIFRYYE